MFEGNAKTKEEEDSEGTSYIVTKRMGLGGRRCKEDGGETEWGNKLQSKRVEVGGRIGIKDKAVQACDATQGKDWLDEENKM